MINVLEYVTNTKADDLAKAHTTRELREMYVQIASNDPFAKSLRKHDVIAALKRIARARNTGKAFARTL